MLYFSWFTLPRSIAQKVTVLPVLPVPHREHPPLSFADARRDERRQMGCDRTTSSNASPLRSSFFSPTPDTLATDGLNFLSGDVLRLRFADPPGRGQVEPCARQCPDR